MEIYSGILIIHIISGFTALFVAPVALAVHKGGKAHKIWGKAFVYAMTILAFSAWTMSVLKPNMFLALVGVFSFYQVLYGYRSLYRKKMKSVKDLKVTDWLMITISGLFSLLLFIFGVYIFIVNNFHPLGIIAALFGGLGLYSAILEVIRSFKTNYYRENWMYNHMAGMIGGYIATVSAFSVVNFTFMPEFIRWTWPTLIGVPLMIIWINKYKNKKSAKPAAIH